VRQSKPSLVTTAGHMTFDLMEPPPHEGEKKRKAWRKAEMLPGFFFCARWLLAAAAASSLLVEPPPRAKRHSACAARVILPCHGRRPLSSLAIADSPVLEIEKGRAAISLLYESPSGRSPARHRWSA